MNMRETNKKITAAPLQGSGGISILRYQEFLEEVGGDENLVAELFDGFVEDSYRRLKDAEEALNSRDYSRLHLEVHSIKGGALNLMADDLADSALRLEPVIKAGDSQVENLQKRLIELKMALNRFAEAWDSIRENNEADSS